MPIRKSLATAALCLLALPLSIAQTVSQTVSQTASQTGDRPPDYRGVDTRVAGIFVTPIAGAPFSATVDIVSTQKLADGTSNTRTTVNHVARDSAGRIYNERRQMVATSFRGEPVLLSSHIYDPNTHLNTFLNPFDRLARQSIFKQAQPTNPNFVPTLGPHAGAQFTKEEQLGEQTIGTTRLTGTRKTWIVPVNLSEIGRQISIVDEYWYSPELSVYMIVKHEDPRTGEQIVAVKDIDRNEPDPARFLIPAGFKVVDETPPE